MSKLDLESVRATLQRLEDSIILDLFERSRYKTNEVIYKAGEIEIPGFQGSFLDYMLKGTEKLHAKAGRYKDPKEHPFFNDLPETIVEREPAERPIKEVEINLNPEIKEMYIDSIPLICESGDDGEYGSSAVRDIRCLQDISKRVHFGKWVAEVKFQEKKELYSKLIEDEDKESIRGELRERKVEEKISRRVKAKGGRYKLDPELVKKFYMEKIIPLTTKVEVKYFLNRI